MNAQEKFDWEIAHHKYDKLAGDEQCARGGQSLQIGNDAIGRGGGYLLACQALAGAMWTETFASLEGGDERIRYIPSASYNDVKGVMKGSDRSTFNINNTLSYTYKNIIFRNQMDHSLTPLTNRPTGCSANTSD